MAERGRVGRRLQRILLLVPYAIHHPGVTIDELARKFNVSKKELRADLELLFLCGLPGYGPGDLIDVSIDEEHVYVRMADYFAAPLRFTPAEALTLYAGAAALLDSPGMELADALNRARDKLGRALGLKQEPGRTPEIDVALGSPGAGHLSTIRAAVVDRKQLHLEYFSASRGELTSRTVDPWGLIAALGRWYLVACDHASGDERMFRVDRIKDVETLDAEAVVPDDFDPSSYRGVFRERGDEPSLSLEISPAIARWFGDYYPVRRVEPLADGWERVELAATSDRWAANLVLQLGPGVRAVRPETVMDRAKEMARAIAARYRP